MIKCIRKPNLDRKAKEALIYEGLNDVTLKSV